MKLCTDIYGPQTMTWSTPDYHQQLVDMFWVLVICLHIYCIYYNYLADGHVLFRCCPLRWHHQ